ncbi:hypothetical protein SBV1_1050003 [Verrucomicrobia bacterium]|nr:hypothetical protein SBV1_1050003 [Verrucomicrobiota bacterium]
MTEAEVVRKMRAHLEGLFPKVCPNCARHFPNLQEFLQNTEHLGPAMPHDAEVGNWNPLNPIGTATYANCRCGTTMALTSEGMPLSELWPLLNWARVETKRRGMTARELLNYLRDEICKQVLAQPDRGGSDRLE